ncbi:MAG: hypothetical protein KJ944_21340 [Alphaproteobacteria bacterium]|nr:hypothetical protein [Alphaproteobacteria bacterium]MBU1559757.1 hypothetical protein [Alphaproteobacteria bacterium]MBU2305136.1 hypothetical protein [Alphaproteobacteria bacterium]MBU2367941.1 hypothetical protein [Alphaproteobacteria bacterium]
MSKIKDPILFSAHFNVDPVALEVAGLVDPFLNVDTQLFIDPVLLAKSGNPHINPGGHEAFRTHFGNYVRLLAISEKEGDVAWRNAAKLLNLDEPAENGLGYGGKRRAGASRPEEVRTAIMRTSKEIIMLGTKDPEMISLMGFFEENVGPDTISDFTTRAISVSLAAITAEFCKANGVPLHASEDHPGVDLPRYEKPEGGMSHIVLVPRDVVRDLPVARDWADIERAAMENARIRERVNQLLAGIVEPSITDRKHALREAALGSAKDFEGFLASVKEHTDSYDPNLDILGYYRLKQILRDGMDGLKGQQGYDVDGKGAEEIRRLVLDTIDVFRRHVEHGNLWEELWVGDKPKKERAAQLIYYAIADCFCHANDVDISPEANMGGGPIDFKFSKGYNARVLVEMKRSGGTVVHGYEKQLKFYKEASQTEWAVFIVMDFGDLGGKRERINAIRAERLAKGERASEIIVIDATRKASASKRD